MRIEESLNVTFDESLPERKSSPSEEDDRINEPIVQDLNGSPSLQVNVSDEGYPKGLKEARGHPIEQVIGELNERTLRYIQEHLEGNALGLWIVALNKGEQRSRGSTGRRKAKQSKAKKRKAKQRMLI
ncbi:hypothetical protein Tco_1169883, partial [Tanacetum coccineum]